MANQAKYIGVDVGASKTLVCLFNDTAEMVAKSQFPTPKAAGDFETNLLKACKAIAAKHRFKAIGLALPGSIDFATGAMLAGGNLPWQNVNPGAVLVEKLKIPVAVQNDANLGGLAEAHLGSGQNYQTVLYVTISTGVGTGLVIDGQIPPGLYKSEGGMMVFAAKDNTYKRLEDLVSGPDFKARFGKYGWDVIDPHIWEAFARDLAAGLFNMITLIGPDVVVLGGGMCVHFDAFKKPLLTYLAQLNPGLYPLPPVKKAANVETAVVLGAYLLAKQRATKK